MIFMIILTILWYRYFGDTEKNVLEKNVRIELINNGKIDYLNAIPLDDIEVIPTYYFRVRNNVDVPVKYEILISDIDSITADDGCMEGGLFTREEISYELFKDNKSIRKGKLSEISDNILLNDEMKGSMTNDYAFRAWLNENAKDTIEKHYHYVINIREIE